MQELLNTCLREFVAIFPREMRPQLVRGLMELRAPINQLAWEIVGAEERGTLFAEAANRETQFPLMAKIHRGLLDLLQFELPASDLVALRMMLRRARLADHEPYQRLLQVAAKSGAGPGPALARFAYYQALRLHVWLTTWDDPGGLEASGAMDLLDHTAEGMLREGLDAVHVVPGAVPMTILVVRSLHALDRHVRETENDLRQSGGEYVRRWNRLADGYRIARRLAAPEGVVLRTAVDGAFGLPKPADARLVDLHPLAFPSKSKDALHQTRSRLKRRLRETPGLAARKTRFVDLVRELMEVHG